MKIKESFLILLFCCLYLTLYSQPKGIYVLDSNNGTFRDANIRNYSFVDGYVWRTSWSEIETAKDNYNFDGIDHIVKKLDAINKKLTILFGAYAVEPEYVASHSGVISYSFTNPIDKTTTKRAVPYDTYLMQRFQIFLTALANHKIYSISTSTMVALKDHPVLSNIATNIAGLGAIRNVNGQNTSLNTVLPNYNRNVFTASILSGMKIQTDLFPSKNVFIPFYKNINDNISSPTLESDIKTKLLSLFDGVKNPKISFWQENLAGYTDASTNTFTGLPLTTFATPLLELNDNAYTMFQMLQGWTTPFLDPNKTANSTPFDAMCYAYNTYGASYYEIYVSDIDNLNYQTAFNNWTASNCTIKPTTEIKSGKISIYPNPSLHTISIGGIDTHQKLKISIFDEKANLQLLTEIPEDIDISSLSNGVYYVQIKQNKKISNLKLIKN
ncbi:T9SS type A sorting domain-containing protein [Flavobacterium flavipallidum]|uniref:T9SS type A sorting domain-containing protein n=1 Tax=Flavobacterium flavipallidum TaxID=3139140 RepID=A0ABU9HQT1_9FLAO